MKKLLFIILTLTGCIVFGQQSEVDQIAIAVDAIELDATLTLEEFDLSLLTGINTDNGGIIKVWHNENQISKVYEEFGLSFGRMKTTFYLKNNEVIKIVEIEENFPISLDKIDSTKLEEVFRIEILVFGPDNNIPGLYDFEFTRKGQRVLSDGFCELSDFFSTLDRAEKAIREYSKFNK